MTCIIGQDHLQISTLSSQQLAPLGLYRRHYYLLLVTMTARVGSVFLGDNQRFRMFTNSTPPSSPGHSPGSMSTIFPAISPPQSPRRSISTATATAHAPTPAVIDPALSLELRLRWLEAILLGVRQDRKGKDKPNDFTHGETLIRLAEDVQRRLDTVVESNDGLKKFMDHCRSLSSPSLVIIIDVFSKMTSMRIS